MTTPLTTAVFLQHKWLGHKIRQLQISDRLQAPEMEGGWVCASISLDMHAGPQPGMFAVTPVIPLSAV